MFSKETYLSPYGQEVTPIVAIEKQVSTVSSTNYQKSNRPVWKEVQLYWKAVIYGLIKTILSALCWDQTFTASIDKMRSNEWAVFDLKLMSYSYLTLPITEEISSSLPCKMLIVSFIINEA